MPIRANIQSSNYGVYEHNRCVEMAKPAVVNDNMNGCAVADRFVYLCFCGNQRSKSRTVEADTALIQAVFKEQKTVVEGLYTPFFQKAI